MASQDSFELLLLQKNIAPEMQDRRLQFIGGTGQPVVDLETDLLLTRAP